MGNICEMAWMSHMPPSSGIQWFCPSSLFYCRHLENHDHAAIKNPDTLEHGYAWSTPFRKVSVNSACALTVDKGKEKAHGTMSLAFSLLSQMIWITAWPISWIVKKNPMLTQLDSVISARFQRLFWRGLPSVCINNTLLPRPYDLLSRGIAVNSNS